MTETTTTMVPLPPSASRQQDRLLGSTPEVEECKDGHICENGSRCVPNQYNEGTYFCDCDAISTSRFAGILCEHKATAFCQRGTTESRHAFCTNRGECKDFVGIKDVHAGCKCPGGYEGPYCQFVEGSAPSDPFLVGGGSGLASAARAAGGDAGGMSTGGTVGVYMAMIAVVFVLLAGTFYLIMKKKESHRSVVGTLTGGRFGSDLDGEFVGGSTRSAPVSEHTLDADGGVLQTAFSDDQSMTHESNLSDVDLDGGDEPANDEPSMLGGGSRDVPEII